MMLFTAGTSGIATISSGDPFAALGGAEGLDALATGSTIIGIAVSVVFFVWLFALGVLLPWFAWRGKVYSKKQYLLTRRMFEAMRQRSVRPPETPDSAPPRQNRAA